jgi:RimJ/RimL family protein N-acetyltransferase
MNDILKETVLKNGKPLTLRRSSPSDARQILDFLNKVGGESDNLMFGKNGFMHMSVEHEVEYLEKLNASPNTLSLAGFADGRLISLSQVQGEPPLRAAHNFELSIVVAKDFWGLGAGSAAMAEMIRFVKEHGGRVIHLGVRAGNEAAISLYEKFGFEKAGVHRDFFNIGGTYYDEILMDLFLA